MASVLQVGESTLEGIDCTAVWTPLLLWMDALTMGEELNFIYIYLDSLETGSHPVVKACLKITDGYLPLSPWCWA